VHAVTVKPQRPRIFVWLLGAALLFLIVARSSLMPESVAFITPVIVAVALIIALLSFGGGLRIPLSMLGVLALTVILVVSTGAREGTSDTVKALGIGLMWSSALLCGMAMDANVRRFLVRFLLVVATIETGVAVLETLVGLEAIRGSVAGTTSDVYIVRANTILGDWTNRAQGTLGYPIPLAHFLSIAWILTAVSDAIRGRWRWMLLVWLTLGILLTGTRTALVAVAVGLVVAVLVRSRRRVIPVFIVIVAAFGGAGFLANYLAQADESNDASFTHRFGVLQAAQQLFGRDIAYVLFGSGVNSQGSLFGGVIFQDGVTGAIDNTYLTMFICAGLLGFIIFIGFFVTAFIAASTPTRAVLAVFGVFFFSYDAVWWHLIATLFWLTIGMAFAERRDRGLNAVEVTTETNPSRVTDVLSGPRR